jgi:hypothetical protein
MAKPVIPFTPHLRFDTTLDLFVRESFTRFDRVYAGVQWTSWQSDERMWSEEYGKFRGPISSRAVPDNLTIAGATLETDAAGDPVLRVASGANITASCGIIYNNYQISNTIEFRLYNASTGALAATGAALGIRADGSYALWARVENIAQRAVTPAEYETLTGVAVAPQFYYYETVGPIEQRFFWDWRRNIGRLPTDTTNPMYVERELLLARNEQLDDPHLADFLVSGAEQSGEWSGIKVVIGAGDWECADGVAPSPGCPMYSKARGDAELLITAVNEPAARVAFDPLARAVTASCVTRKIIRNRAGEIDIPAGSQIIAGLRASRSGPQAGVWILHEDGTARLLGTNEAFSTGACECGKAAHHASDVAQGPDGRLYLLNECGLHVYDPDASSIGEALPGEPRATSGHPGGQCLRWVGNDRLFFTELLSSETDSTDPYYYNRLVRRVGGRDIVGPGSVWHGPNCAEVYQGRLFSIRQKLPFINPKSKQTLDWLQNGRWSGNNRLARLASTTRWQRLRKRGKYLFVFGFAPGLDDSPDVPICANSDGKFFRDVAFPFFVRRATTCALDDGSETLLVTARSQSEGIGRALRVVELPPPSGGGGKGGGAEVCTFWNAVARAFRMTRASWVDAGGNVAKLPPFLAWKARAGTNGGGVWRAATVQPVSGVWLELQTTETLVSYALPVGQTLPFDPEVWNRICFTVHDDGGPGDGPWIIKPKCDHAGCSIIVMPPGTGFRHIRLDVSDDAAPLSSYLVTDKNADRRLRELRDIYPMLWARRDSAAAFNDLTTYTELVSFGEMIVPDGDSESTVDVVVLVPPEAQPTELHALQRRS